MITVYTHVHPGPWEINPNWFYAREEDARQSAEECGQLLIEIQVNTSGPSTYRVFEKDGWSEWR